MWSHTIKGFGIVNKVEIDVFLELSCFFHDPADVGDLISGFSAFSKTSLNIWKFMHKFCQIFIKVVDDHSLFPQTLLATLFKNPLRVSMPVPSTRVLAMSDYLSWSLLPGSTKHLLLADPMASALWVQLDAPLPWTTHHPVLTRALKGQEGVLCTFIWPAPHVLPGTSFSE